MSLVDNSFDPHIVIANQNRDGIHPVSRGSAVVEILILISLCRRIGERAREKGRTAGKYQFMLVLFWFGGEIGGALLTAVGLAVFLGGEPDGFVCIAYIAAIAGAILGAVLAFRIVAGLPEPVDEEDSWDDTPDDPSVKKDSSL
jgi:hypothetical protein